MAGQWLVMDPVARLVHNVVGDTRDNQVLRGYTPEHDAMTHSPESMLEMIQQRLHIVAEELVSDEVDAFKKMAQAAALIEAYMYQQYVANPGLLDG